MGPRHGPSFLEYCELNLSPEQVAAARSVGCAFFPASELQVQRLTMQQRIFRVEGKPFLLSRDGSYYETAGTLRVLIADVVMPEPEPAPEPAAEPEAPAPEAIRPEAPEPEAIDAPEPEATVAPTPEPAPIAAEAPPAPRKRGRPRKLPLAALPPAEPEEASPAAEAAPAPRKRGRPRKLPLAAPLPIEPEPEDPGVAVEAPPAKAAAAATPAAGDTARSERRARLARRRAGGPVPNWQTAGPARRGRLRRF